MIDKIRDNKENQSALNIYILGPMGVPAKHGGFETFEEKLSIYLVRKAGMSSFTAKRKAMEAYLEPSGTEYREFMFS